MTVIDAEDMTVVDAEDMTVVDQALYSSLVDLQQDMVRGLQLS